MYGNGNKVPQFSTLVSYGWPTVSNCLNFGNSIVLSFLKSYLTVLILYIFLTCYSLWPIGSRCTSCSGLRRTCAWTGLPQVYNTEPEVVHEGNSQNSIHLHWYFLSVDWSVCDFGNWTVDRLVPRCCEQTCCDSS